ncbi:MAG: radical SAM protein [Candidatus Thermoplasmatota archaeon]|nr:radical SAM protein [Candidatus Thermoplasmatota archaeon]
MQGNKEIFRRLSSFEQHKIMGPLNLFLFVSTSCPLKCSFCARSVFLDLKRGKESDIDRFTAISLFGLDPKLFSSIRAKIVLGIETLEDEIAAKKVTMIASDKIDRIINGSGPLDYSKYEGLAGIIEELPQEVRISLYAYSIHRIREKLTRDMQKRMPLEDYLRVVREAAELGVKQIYLTGAIGEPLSDRDFLWEIMREIGKHDIVGHLTTNGYYADADFAKELVEMEWRSLIISIDGARPKTHDRLRGKDGSFERAFSFLKQLTKAKRIAKKVFPRITISFVVNRLNYFEIVDHFELMAESGADSVYYSPIRIYTDEARRTLVMQSEEEKKLRQLIEVGKPPWADSGVENNIDSLPYWPKSYGYGPCVYPKIGIMEDIVRFTGWNGTPSNKKVDLNGIKCTEPWLSMAVDANGSVMQCCVSSIPLINMNVTDHSLGEIWHSGKYHHLRDYFIEGKLPFECQHHCLPPVMEDQKKLIAGFREMKKASEINTKGTIANTLERVDNEISRLTRINLKKKMNEIRNRLSEG